MDSGILQLVVDQNSPDNNLRKTAELEFIRLSAQDPSQVAYVLVSASSNDQYPIDVRQSSLLHLKRLVPKYWSIGFQLFVGPPITQELKVMIRESLINLATSSPQLKLRSGAAYVIVQIAAADYPDEWPDLLTSLYSHTTNFQNHIAVIGGLAVLNDLFDDLITEEQFWEGGVGAQLIGHISNMLGQNLPAAIKTSALKLYLTVFNTLLSAEATESPERKQAVNDHISVFGNLLLSLLRALVASQSSELAEFQFRSSLYKVFAHVLSSFRRQVGVAVRTEVFLVLLLDFSFASAVFRVVVVEGNDSSVQKSEELDDPARCVTNYITELLLTLSLLQHGITILSFSEKTFDEFVRCVVTCAVLPEETVEEYEGNFNSFVTDVTGLSTNFTVRDSIQELLMDLNDKDSANLFNTIKNVSVDPNQNWQLKESYLFLVESLFLNEDSESIGSDLPLASYLSSINALVSVEQGPSNNPLLVSRIFLLLPRFVEKFSLKLEVNSFGATEFRNTFAYASACNFELFELVRASALVSATLWKNLPDFKLSALGNELQVSIFQVAYSLLEDSDEDTLPVLSEAISVAIDIDHRQAFKEVIANELTVIDLILKIGFKDPANVQLTIDSSDCLQTLLEDVSMEEYLHVCQKLVPLILTIIGNALAQQTVEYSPQLYFALELLGYIVNASPAALVGSPDANFPQEVFSYIFPILKDLILRTNDDQILQNGGEVFNNLLQKASKFFLEYTDPETKQSGMDLLLEVAAKFLSPELSDSAAMNCGLIVISLFENFLAYLTNDFFLSLLEATVRRLVVAKEVVTIENLIMVFCKLILNTSPEELVSVLTNMHLTDANGETKSGLQLVLPIWFSSFEVTRGFEKIKQNILALGKIFSLNDERVSTMIVDGELIPYDGDMIVTRSMAKTMPTKYTQIPASLKILSLLAGELGFQCQQPDPTDYLPENAEEDEEGEGGGEWEDMDDIGVPNYEKLKSYVDSDDEGDEGTDQGIKEMLVQFFRECTVKNLGNFQSYYDMLTDEEKKIITENLVFD